MVRSIRSAPTKISRVKADKSDWDVLMEHIEIYKEAAIKESWSGGGDPTDVPLLEAELELATLKLEKHVQQMRDRRGESTPERRKQLGQE